MPDWKNKLFFGDNLGLLNSRGAPGHAPIPSKRATHWHHPAFPCSIPRTCIESNPAPIIQIRRGRRSRRIADPQTWAIPTLMGGPRGARYQARELLVNIHPVLQCSIPGARLKSNLPIAGADHPDQPKATHPPISTLQMGRPATPRGGAGQPMQERYSASPYCSPVQYPGEGTISRPISMRLADRCFGPCGTAVRRLPGTPVGDTPICARSRAREGKGLGVDAETWLNALSPSSNFEYLVIPHHHSGSSTSIVGGLVMKQEMNEYSTFDRLYREIRAVRSGLRTAAGCRNSCGRGAQPAQTPTSGSGS
jgi:hypothetical protein